MKVSLALAGTALAGALLTGCGFGSSTDSLRPTTPVIELGTVHGTLEVEGGTSSAFLMPIAGRVWFARNQYEAMSLLCDTPDLHGCQDKRIAFLKVVHVGPSGRFSTTMTAGTWVVFGSSPRYMNGHGAQSTCRGGNVDVTERSSISVLLICISK
jgi:hypothetical protein